MAMSMAFTLERYLSEVPAHYDLLWHPHTATSLQCARKGHVPKESVAKAVVLEDEEHHFVMAVLPATRKVQFALLHEQTGRSMYLADEQDLGRLFADCEVGAVPPLGAAYGLETLWDEDLLESGDLYFEAGDHETLIHMKTSDFIRLLGDADPMHFSVPNEVNADLDFTFIADNVDRSWRDVDDWN
jgi:Ala-tRNA(Pro) deacylase